MKSDDLNLNVLQMVKCDCCGQHHLLEECEVVVIKIVKGKHCSIDGYTSHKENKSINTFEPRVDRGNKSNSIIPPGLKDFRSERDTIVQTPKIQSVDDMSDVVDGRIIKKPKSIIPAGISSMMIPQDDPNFESKGAKEIRRV